MLYNHAETYNGQDIVIDVYLNTGTTSESDGKGNLAPVRTHTINASLDGEITTLVGIKTSGLAQTLTTTLSNIKALVDNSSDPAILAILTGLGYAEIAGLSAPADFAAVTGPPGGNIDLTWTNDVSADGYIISRSADPIFMDGTEIELFNGAYPASFTDAALVSGDLYYYRIIAYKVGITASLPSKAFAIAS